MITSDTFPCVSKYSVISVRKLSRIVEYSFTITRLSGGSDPFSNVVSLDCVSASVFSRSMYNTSPWVVLNPRKSLPFATATANCNASQLFPILDFAVNTTSPFAMITSTMYSIGGKSAVTSSLAVLYTIFFRFFTGLTIPPSGTAFP